MPDYAVRNTNTGEVRIVSAARPATALAHVVTPLFNVTLATAQDGIDAGRQGRRVEIAGEEGGEPPIWVTDPMPPRADAQRGLNNALPPRVDGDPADAPQFDTTCQQEGEDR